MNRTLMALLGVIFLITTATSFAVDCGDVNNTGTVNIQDITYLINFLYKDGPTPFCWGRPVLSTAEISEIAQTTAQCGGTITSDGGATVTARGVCWSTNLTPTVLDSKTTDGAGAGSFISYITGLIGNTSYYVRAYATNNAGTGYGMTMAFTTSAMLPVLTTADISEITQTTAQCGGIITSDGGATVTARGVCWSTNPAPTVADSKTIDGAGIGSFASSIIGLTGNTLYYVRAYATNSAGTGYGMTMAFTTSPIPPVLTTAAVSEITLTTAQCGGTIASDGGATVTARGVCWSTNLTPTVADSKTTDGTGIGSFTSYITGLTAGATYYARAYATNIMGTGYGNTVSFTTVHETGIVTDIDGNIYQTVKIGDQWWMAENLKAVHYCNSDAIPKVTDGSIWGGLTNGAYCEYDNNISNVETYGRLYNWYSVNDSRNVAPEGWHVPSDAEWQTLVDYLGGDDVAGGKMKEAGTTHWVSPDTGATNESGFTALPGGYRAGYGYYGDMGSYAHFWSSTESSIPNAWNRSLREAIWRAYNYKGSGFSVRCVKD